MLYVEAAAHVAVQVMLSDVACVNTHKPVKFKFPVMAALAFVSPFDTGVRGSGKDRASLR